MRSEDELEEGGRAQERDQHQLEGSLKGNRTQTEAVEDREWALPTTVSPSDTCLVPLHGPGGRSEACVTHAGLGFLNSGPGAELGPSKGKQVTVGGQGGIPGPVAAAQRQRA